MTEQNVTLPATAHIAGDSPTRAQLILCFATAILAMLPTQLFRLSQTEALPWLLADYGGRILSLGVLISLPAGQWCLRQKDKLKVGLLEVFLWIVGLVFLFKVMPLGQMLASILSETALGAFPRSYGWIHLFNLTLGIMLVALHEELVFRKLAYHALKPNFASERAVVMASALIFAAFHWWTGVGNMIGVALFALLAMPCYRRTGSLWPIGIAHYLLDVIAFA